MSVFLTERGNRFYLETDCELFQWYNWFSSTEHEPTDDDDDEREHSTDEPSVNLCTWRPKEEDTSALTTDGGDETIAAPTLHPRTFRKDTVGEAVMGPSLPAVKVSATRHGDSPGIWAQQTRRQLVWF